MDKKIDVIEGDKPAENNSKENEDKTMKTAAKTTAEKTVKRAAKAAARKARKAEKSGWSVVTVPALLTVKQIPALAGLRVRPIRDERHHKVGYVGRGKNGKTVLVWRDWYVKRTTDEARKALLKREKINA